MFSDWVIFSWKHSVRHVMGAGFQSIVCKVRLQHLQMNQPINLQEYENWTQKSLSQVLELLSFTIYVDIEMFVSAQQSTCEPWFFFFVFLILKMLLLFRIINSIVWQSLLSYKLKCETLFLFVCIPQFAIRVMNKKCFYLFFKEIFCLEMACF